MNIRLTRNRVLIELVPVETETKSGIVIPETASPTSPETKQGVVHGMGPKVTIPIQIGDHVLVAKYFLNQVHLDCGQKFLILDETNILAVLS